jgi:hypothetical protein
MARFKHSVVISRPVERVFAFVSDVENDHLGVGWHRCAGVQQARAVPPLSGCISGCWAAVLMSSWQWPATNQTT